MRRSTASARSTTIPSKSGGTDMVGQDQKGPKGILVEGKVSVQYNFNRSIQTNSAIRLLIILRNRHLRA